MANRMFLAGSTSQSMDVFIQDTSSVTGAGLTGLVFNSSGLNAYYRAGPTGTATTISLVTQTVGGAWTSGGFVEIDNAHMKGVYRLDLPNAVVASTPYSTVYLYGAANMAPVAAELQVTSMDPNSANWGMVNVSANVNALTAGSLTNIGGACWDAVMASHTTSGSFGQVVGALRSGTAQAGAATTITLDASASSTDSYYNAAMIVLTGGTGIGQARFVTAYVGATKVATVDSTWQTTPDNTSVFYIIPFPSASGLDQPGVRTALGMASANMDTQFSSVLNSFPTNSSLMNVDSNGNVAVQSNIKKNTASNGFTFLMTDSTTHAPKSGISSIAGTVSIDGAAFVSLTNAVSEVGSGTYKINLAAADTNGNHLQLRFTATNADDRNIGIVTQP